MPQLQIDFSSVEDFAAIPEGSYAVTVDHVEMKTSNDTGNPYLGWDLIVSDGENAGRHLFMNTGLTEKSLWRLKALLQNLGVLEDQMTFDVDEDSNYVISPELSGLPAIAIVSTSVYKGKLQNNVDDLVSIDEGAAPVKLAVAPAKSPMTSSKPGIGSPKPQSKAPALKLK